jgi:DNA polymerase-1
MTTALIDGDIVAFRCAASCEPTKSKPYLETLDDAVHRTEGLLQDLIHDVEATVYRLPLGGSGNFRKKISQQYKANRTTPPPTYLGAVQAYLVDHWDAFFVDGIETDDQLGIDQTTGTDTVICSIDKDLLQVPGRHYNFVKKEFTNVTEQEGWKNFWTQMVLGDRSDNVMGYDGRARTTVPQFLLGTLQDLSALEPEEAFRYTYNLYHDKDAFNLNYKLLWILRTPEIEWPFLQEQLELVHA